MKITTEQFGDRAAPYSSQHRNSPIMGIPASLHPLSVGPHDIAGSKGARTHESEAAFVWNVRRWLAAALLTFGLITIALQVVSVNTLVTNTPAAFALLLTGFIVMLTTLVWGITSYPVLVGVMSASALLSIFLTPDRYPPDFSLTAQWLLHACSIAGILLATRYAVWVIFGTASVAAVMMFSVVGGSFTYAIVAGIAVILIDVIGISMGNNAAVTIWYSYAQRRDRQFHGTVSAEVKAARARDSMADREQLRLHLHDAVLKLFGAVREIGAGTLSKRVQGWATDCLHEIDEASRLPPRPRTISDKLAAAFYAEAEQIGVTITLTLSPSNTETVVPQRAMFGFEACARAALLNVADHAHVTAAHITITETPNSVTVLISDQGRGFVTRSGGALSVQQRGDYFGVEVDVHSSPGNGTSISIEWNTKSLSLDSDEDAQFATIMNHSLALIVRRIVFWTGGAYIMQAVISPEIGHRLLNWLALIFIGGIIAVLIARPNPWPIAWVGTFAATVIIPVALAVFAIGPGVCSASEDTFIAPSLSMIGVIVGIGLSPTFLRRSVPVVTYIVLAGTVVALALSVDTDCGMAQLGNYITDLATIGILVIILRSFDRFLRELAHSRRSETDAIESELAAREQEISLSEEIGAALTNSRRIVAAIADGTNPSAQPDLRNAINWEEPRLRNLFTIDPVEVAPLTEALRAAADIAHRERINLNISVISGEWPLGGRPSDDAAAALSAFLTALVPYMRNDPSPQINMVVNDPDPICCVIRGMSYPQDIPTFKSDLVVDTFHTDGQTILTIGWQRPATPA